MTTGKKLFNKIFVSLLFACIITCSAAAGVSMIRADGNLSVSLSGEIAGEYKRNTYFAIPSVISPSGISARLIYPDGKEFTGKKALLSKEGKYVLKSFDDYKYLPCVLVSGDFKIQATADGSNAVTLKNRQKTYTCGDFFRDFGKVEFCINVTVPNGAEGIEIVGTSLYTCVYVNDTLVGKKICSPYIYNISEKWYDKNIVLKVVQYSSIAPIFGDVKYFDEHSENIQWKDAPLPSNSGFGFKEINWL